MAVTCSRCGVKQGLFEAMNADMAATSYTCPTCAPIVAKEKEERLALLRARAAKIILTTTPSVDGHAITEYLGIESVEFVLGTGLFSEIGSDFQDFLGRRSKGFEDKLQTAKRTAFEAFAMLAAERGADAAVGMDIDYTEFSGNRIGLVVNGTLVKLSPARKEPFVS